MSVDQPPPAEVKTALEESRRRSLASGSTFHFAFKILPEVKRDSLFAVYHFCRLVDDAVDSGAEQAEKAARLDELERGLDSGQNGQLWRALAWVRENYEIPDTYFYELIEGARSDIGSVRIDDFEELDRYCYRVASTVGLITLHIFNQRARSVLEKGKKLGLAYQYTNILRDVAEDRAMDRCYLPRELLAENSALGAWDERRMTTGFREVLESMAEVARENYAASVELLADLKDWRCRFSVALMTAAYSRYLDRLKKSNFNVWQQRVELSGLDYPLFFLRGVGASVGKPESCLYV